MYICNAVSERAPATVQVPAVTTNSKLMVQKMINVPLTPNNTCKRQNDPDGLSLIINS